MTENETTIWGIHGGRTGDADSLFLHRNRVAIGWRKMGDVTTLKPTREDFKAKYIQVYPDEKPGAIPGQAGQIFRFVHEMKEGDVVVYPSKRDRQVHIGQVAGPYKYEPKLDPAYPQMREVKWLRSVHRRRLDALFASLLDQIFKRKM